MSIDLSYGYANARIRAMHAAMLTPEKYRELATVQSVAEMTALLEETPYREDLVAAAQKAEGIQALLEGLQANFSRTLTKLSHVVPKKAGALYEVAVAEWDVLDLKTVLAKKFLNQEVTDRELFLASESSQRVVRKIRQAETFSKALDVLKSMGYGDVVPKAQMQSGESKEPNLPALLDALDQRLYSKWKIAANDPKTESNTRALLKQRLELVNTLLVLRLKKIMPAAEIRQKLVTAPSPRARALLDAKDLDAAIGLLELPEETRALYEKTSALSVIELALEKRFVQTALRRLRFSVLSFGTVLGFLYLKSAEITQLKRMALGKYFGVDEEMKNHAYW